jgi:hypothetical protein
MMIFKAAKAVSKIHLSLKPNHHNQVKLVQICEMRCIFSDINSLFTNPNFRWSDAGIDLVERQSLDRHLLRVHLLRDGAEHVVSASDQPGGPRSDPLVSGQQQQRFNSGEFEGYHRPQM